MNIVFISRLFIILWMLFVNNSLVTEVYSLMFPTTGYDPESATCKFLPTTVMLTSHLLLSFPIAIFQQQHIVKMTAIHIWQRNETCAVMFGIILYLWGPCGPQSV
jgi:hypothetical protein